MKNYDVNIGYIAGIVGRVTEMHALYYSGNWGFGKYFETKVATGLSDFVSNCSATKDLIISLSINGKIEGSIFVDGSSDDANIAHLRWFIVSEKLRGKGAGNFLMNKAMKFCRENKYDSVYLWTFKGLDSARHLYEKYGFSLTEENPGDQWGTVVTEQRFDADLLSP